MKETLVSRLKRPYDIPTLAIVVITALCIFFGVYYAVGVAKWMPLANQIDFGEGFTMYVGKLWASGQWNWNPNVEPYMTLMYGPVLPILLTPLIHLFGFSLALGRAVMIISTLITCGLLYLIALKLTGRRLYGVIAGLLPLANPIIKDWSLMARTDMLAVMFSVAGVYLFIRFKESPKGWLYASIPLFVLAFYTKQTAIAGVLAVMIYLLIKNRRTFVKYAIAFIMPIGVILVIGNLLTGNEFFRHMFVYNQTYPTFWPLNAILEVLQDVLIITATPLILGFVYAIKHPKGFASIYFLTALMTGLATLFRNGSFLNYMIEATFAASLCAALLLPELAEWLRSQKTTSPMPASYIGIKKTTIIYALLTVLIYYLAFMGCQHAFPFPNEKYENEFAVAAAMISDTNEPIPTENAGLALYAGKVPYIEPFVFTDMTDLGYWNETQYIEDLNNQRFDYIIAIAPITNPPRSGHGHFSHAVIKAINENYSVAYYPEANYYWYGLCVYEANERIENEK